MDFDENEDYDFNDTELDIFDLPSSESDNSEIDAKKESKTIGMKDRVHMINNRTRIEKLKESVTQTGEKYQLIKDELAICDNHILELKKEESMTLAAIETNQTNGNIAAVYRLQGQLKRVIIEQEGERDVQHIIEQRLVDAEKEFIKSQLEEGKYISEEIALKEDELKYEGTQKKIQKQRINKELKLTKDAQRLLEIKKCEIQKSVEDDECQRLGTQRAIAEALSKHSKYLQKTSKDEKNAKIKIENKKMEDQKKKEESFQKLKRDIQQTKDNMTAINAKRKADELEQLKKERNIQQSTIIKGGNPKLELKKYQNVIKTNDSRDQFLTNVKEGKIEIAKKITEEETNITRKKQQMPFLFTKDKIRKNVTNTLELFANDKKGFEDIKDGPHETWETWDIRSCAGRSSVNLSLENENVTTSSGGEQEALTLNYIDSLEPDINTPEFQGMWNSTVAYKVPKDSQLLPIKDVNATKMEQDIMQRVLSQLKENIVKPQVVGGKLFKGKSFQSKPEIIQFENLEVGQVYTQKVTLTNTSYGINQCRFQRISEHLMDFVSIRFSPSGPLSPGMTFEFTVTFEPKLGQDLYGDVFFTSQSERFSIPLVCLTKKCKMSIDKQQIKFNTSVIGETLIQSVFLKNSGAKGTFCRIQNTAMVNTERETDVVEIEVGESDKNTEIEEKKVSNDEKNEYDCIATSLGDEKLWIDAYKEQEVIIKWSPIIAGDYDENFRISFDDDDNDGFDLSVIAKAIDVPVFVTNPTISMDICMMDRLYQDTIVFHSRAATALKMQFKVPDDIENYLEILPNMGFIQAGQDFKAQLKLVVKPSIYNENCRFFDPKTDILDVPISACIANQTKTVDFNIQAVLTITDLTITSLGSDPSVIDFGHCTILETKVKSLKLTNNSILPQEFGFTGYPEYVEIQPNHGYGLILPKEELEFQVLFSPKKAENFKFQVKCQTIIDRSFSLSCRGVGVHPPLELSKQIITFPYTAVNDISIADVFIHNNHVSTNIYTHEPARIGTEAVTPVGPKTYQFMIQDSKDISIHPRIGTVQPGEKQKLTIFFKPKLSDEEIKKEAAEIVNMALESESKRKWEHEICELEKLKDLEPVATKDQSAEKEIVNPKKSSKKPTRPQSNKEKTGTALQDLIEAGPLPIRKVEQEEISVDSDDYLKGKLSLLQKYDFNFKIVNLKCLIADGSMLQAEKLVYNPKNLLQLELHCPYVKPDLIILSNNGRTLIDFGENITNQKIAHVISVQNISSTSFQLCSSNLDPNGAFKICNALRKIEPNAVANIVVAFNANCEGVFETNFTIFGKRRSKMLKLRFRAVAMFPKVEIKELSDGVFNAGTVMINEFLEKSLTLMNNSCIDIRYKLELIPGSICPQIPGVSNKSGISVFTLTPQSGLIPAGKSYSVTLTFAPDHESSKFRAVGRLILFEQVTALEFIIKGESMSNVLYLKEINENIERPLEYFGETWKNSDSINADISTISRPSDGIVLILRSSVSDTGSVIEGKGVFVIGCVRTMAVSQKKNGEFTIDNLNILTALGFKVDSIKGQIEADSEKEITVSWAPTQSYDMGTIVSTLLNLTLKGDISTANIIHLKAYCR